MDWIISDELGLTVGHLVGWGAAGAMIIGGVAPYIPQYRQIKKTQDAEGFSLYVCLALLIANTLRILFWFGKRYELPLLIQSIVMNITMFVMIHLCVNVRKKNQIIRARERIFTGAIFMLYILLCCVNGSAQPDQTARWLDQRSGISGGEKPHRFYATIHALTMLFGVYSVLLFAFIFPLHVSSVSYNEWKWHMERKYFWAWTDFQSYVDCMLVFSVLGAAITYLLIEFSPFVEMIGFLALFTEAMLGAPQIAKNHKNKSTEGMSVSMVIMWTCGDVFKTAYFVLREAPPQFWLCGSLQVSLDVVILFQLNIELSLSCTTEHSALLLELLYYSIFLNVPFTSYSGDCLYIVGSVLFQSLLNLGAILSLFNVHTALNTQPKQVWLYRHNTAAARRQRRGD